MIIIIGKKTLTGKKTEVSIRNLFKMNKALVQQTFLKCDQTPLWGLYLA